MWRRLRPGVLAGLLQEAAIAHSEELDAGRARTLDRGALWVIARTYMEIDRLPVYGEDVTLRTWPGETMHVLFPRYFEMSLSSGERLLRVSSLWLLIDQRKRSMVFPDELGISVAGVERAGALPLPDRRIPFPASLPERRERQVRYSEVDLNGHLNNSRYLDWAEDLLDPEFHRDHPLRSLWVEYRSEIRSGETVELQSCLDNGALFLRGQKGDTEYFQLRADYGTI